jgi:hypothetical protein
MNAPLREFPSDSSGAIGWHPGKLWSLWDMLNDWGYDYLNIGTALAYVETDLENHRKRTNGAIAGHGTSILDPDDQVAHFVQSKCDEILRLAPNHDLEPIPTNIEILKATIIKARMQKPHGPEIYTNDILKDVQRIRNNFIVILSKRFFYYVRSDLSKYYGKPELFGETVAAEFPAAPSDLERAGNCLALGEGTACVLHLMRAMEAIVWRLGEKLNVKINPRNTWGQILGNMDMAIKALPETTDDELRKKERWSECRLNLHHVKQALRDPSMHATRSYDEKEAQDIIERIREFSQHLATL